MKHISFSLAILALAVSGLFVSCSGATGGTTSLTDDTQSRSVVSTAFTDALSSWNTAVWAKAAWTNGGMFNCGFSPDHATFSSDGKLVLKLDNTASYGKSYSSAEYRTINTYNYGTFTTSMKAAKASGIVSSFFLYTGSPWDEIDVEFLGKNTTQVQFNYFVNGVGGNEKLIDLGFDASTAYHTYAIEYGSGYINWYVDGTWKWGVNNTGLNATYGKTMPSHPMQIMMNLWPGTGVDSWLGSFSYSAPLYAYYDYVKYAPK